MLAQMHRLSFYDALIVAAALEAGCDTLYSEDMQHGRTSARCASRTRSSKARVTMHGQSAPSASPKWGPIALLALPTFALATLYGWAVLVSTAIKPGFIGLNHIALGTDWAVFWGAIRAMLDGNLPLVMDGERFTAFLNSSLQDWLTVPLAYRPWFYPPSFLVLLLPFAPLGFVGSYLAFQAVSAALLAVALLYGADRPRWRATS